MMEDTNLKEAIELAKIRQKDRKVYEDLMSNLFTVYSDFIIFERELDKVLAKFEAAWEAEKK
jgi:hypothetical protein